MSLSQCELCLENQPQSTNTDSFAYKKSIENIIYKLFSLALNITDGYICVECKRFLKECFKFYHKVQNARLSLKTGIKSIEFPLILKEEVSYDGEEEAIKNDVQSTDNVEYCINEDTIIKSEDCCSEQLQVHLKTEFQCVSEPPNRINIASKKYSNDPDISTNNTGIQAALSKEDPSEISRLSDNDIPHVLFKNGRLIPKGETLRKLINNFYNLFCERCSESPTFGSLTDMFEHYKSHHNVKGFVKCCDSRLYGKKQISLHMARHLQPSAFQCPICKKLVSRPGALKYHMQAYHLPESEKPYKCEHCDKRFVYLDGFNIHKSTHLPEKEKEVHECKVCRKIFTNLTYYKGHISRMHKSTDKFICAVCGKEFKMKSTYKYHLTTHERSETGGVQCQECGVWYANILTLRSHMKRHGSKNFTCEQCFSTYYTASDLKNHKKVKHTDLKPFKCSLCAKSFRKKQNLNQHMAQHTGEKRHVCEFCSRTFRQSGNYYTHRKRMHPEYRNISKKVASIQSVIT